MDERFLASSSSICAAWSVGLSSVVPDRTTFGLDLSSAINLLISSLVDLVNSWLDLVLVLPNKNAMTQTYAQFEHGRSTAIKRPNDNYVREENTRATQGKGYARKSDVLPMWMSQTQGD